MKDYCTAEEIAKKWGITVRRVQVMCAEGRIEGAVKFGHAWAVPSDADKPEDGRITSGEYINWRSEKVSQREGK